MTRYRAILFDPGAINQERPIQIFGNNRELIDDWANKVVMQASDHAVVKIYETVEREIAAFIKPELEASKALPQCQTGAPTLPQSPQVNPEKGAQ